MANEDVYDFELVLDLGSVEDSSILPNGRYVAEVVAATPGMSKSNKAKIDLRWKIVDSDNLSLNNRQVFDALSFHENRLPQTKRQLKAMGFDTSGQFNMKLGELAENMLGIRCFLIVDTEPERRDGDQTYEARNRIKRVLPYSDDTLGGLLDAMGPTEDTAF
jgi:hypothetical protein